MKYYKVGFLIVVTSLLSLNVAASPIISSDDPSLSGAKVLNFDSYLANGYLNDFSDGDVTFHKSNQNSQNYFSMNAFLPGTSGRTISLYDFGLFTFSTAESAVSFSLGAINSSWAVEALSVSGDTLETLSIPSRCCIVSTFGFSNLNIYGVKLYSTESVFDVIVIDDLRYVQQVSEPSTFVMTLIGFMFLATIRRKRSKG